MVRFFYFKAISGALPGSAPKLDADSRTARPLHLLLLGARLSDVVVIPPPTTGHHRRHEASHHKHADQQLCRDQAAN